MFWLLVGGTWHQNVCDVILACHPGSIMGALNTESQLNPFDPNFSLTFSKKTEYIFLSYVSIEELFRK